MEPFSLLSTPIPPTWDNYLLDWQNSLLWLLVIGFIIAFCLSFAVGANDSANSFGTSVGAGVMSFKVACILGSICETCGAVFLSSNTIQTITTGVIEIDLYKSTFNETTKQWTPAPNDTLNPETELMIGEVSTILGSAAWQLIASTMGWPVSATHSIVGGLVGFSLVANGTQGINWTKLYKIVAAWFISPVFSGVMTIILYYPIRKYVILQPNSTVRGQLLFPILFGLTAAFDIGTILTTGIIFYNALGWEESYEWVFWLIALVIGSLIGGAVYLGQKTTVNINTHGDAEKKKILERRLESKRLSRVGVHPELALDGISLDDPAFGGGVDNLALEIDEEKKNNLKTTVEDLRTVPEWEDETDPDHDNFGARQVFTSLQYLSAITGSLAHGGNDVGNAIGPILMLWIVWNNPITFEDSATPNWILLYGGLGISAGLILFGRRVIETMGKKITKITPSRGFSIEIMSAATVLVANKIGAPVSTTHCQVGAVVAVGLLRKGLQGINGRLIGKIFVVWVTTLPAAGLLSALFYSIIHAIVIR